MTLQNAFGALALDADPAAATGSITIQDTGTTSTTVGSFQSVAIITGTPTANSFVVLTVSGKSSARIMITGTWTGTLALEKSADGGVTFTTSVWKAQGTSYTTGTTTGNGMFDSSAGAATQIRVRATTAITGTAHIVIQSGHGMEAVNVINPLRLFDNSSGASATIKVSGTTPATTDTGLVTVPRPTGVAVGQTLSNTSAAQLTAISTPATNGILVQAISTNVASVFIGGSGVLTTTGYELQPGQAVPFTCANITSLYVVGANNTDAVCWNVL